MSIRFILSVTVIKCTPAEVRHGMNEKMETQEASFVVLAPGPICAFLGPWLKFYFGPNLA